MLAKPDNTNDSGAPSNGSGNPNPEGWTPEQETALLLDLCEAQMESSIHDADQSVDVLVRVFTDLVEATRDISTAAKQLPAAPSTAAAAADIYRRCDMLSSQVNEAIVAFQFYDKLSQRLGHVRHSLTTLAMFICNRTQTQQRDHWIKLLSSLRRLYRTAEERAVFDLVAQGATAEQVRAGIADSAQPTPENNVELF